MFVSLVIQHVKRMHCISHLWLVWLHHIFPHYLINGMIFGKKITEHKICVSLQLLSERIFILSRTERNVIINVHTSHVKYPLFLSDFNKTWIFRTEFVKKLEYQIHENPSSGSPAVPWGRTDGHDEVHCHFSQCCECAYKCRLSYLRTYRTWNWKYMI